MSGKTTTREQACPACGREGPISAALAVCGRCIRERPDTHLPPILAKHRRFREEHGLPPEPVRSEQGVPCGYCVQECLLSEGELGYCGSRMNQQGKILGGAATARVGWYHDPLPTNCVADWVCPAGADVGHPAYSYRPGPEYGYSNLAVFYEACNFHCLNCQNWRFREMPPGTGDVRPAELASAVQERTACICYFGGDPGPALPHSLKTARMARKNAPGKVLRICWETNGSMKTSFLKGMLKMALESGGLIKFDLKAFHEPVHLALTMTTNRRTLENFAWLAKNFGLRAEYPLLLASTLLVPGVVDAQEVGALSRFIASFSTEIPYALLAFHPDCRLRDLPATSSEQAAACLAAAKQAGLKNVRLGNIYLLA